MLCLSKLKFIIGRAGKKSQKKNIEVAIVFFIKFRWPFLKILSNSEHRDVRKM
jgi:hypothetical protein